MTLTLSVSVNQDEITNDISNRFDFKFEGDVIAEIPSLPQIPKIFSIGLLVGSSGSGKSTLLKNFGSEVKHTWDNKKAIVSHFDNTKDAEEKLSAVGLNSIPNWFKPYAVLSTGEKYRADLARALKDGCVVDEFTSVIDRDAACSTAFAINRFIRKQQMTNVVFASCHFDIIKWLQPDWVFNLDTKSFSLRGCLRRPTIKLEVVPCSVEAWSVFSRHHYLTENINKSAKFWLAYWGSVVVGFTSAIAFPSGTIKNAYREHRTVILPDFQGLGLGVRLSDAIGQMYVNDGFRYFSKTVHPRMGDYRNNSPFWKGTSKNMKGRNERKNSNAKWFVRQGTSYSHEYIGDNR